MKKHEQNHKKTLPSWMKGLFIYIVSIILIIVVIFGIYSVAFAGQIYPRVSVAGIMVGGLKPEQAKEKLTQNLTNDKLRPVIVSADKSSTFTIKPSDIEAKYNIDASVEAAMSLGRNGSFFSNLITKITSPLFGTDVSAKVTLNEDKFATEVKKITDAVNITEKNATIEVKDGVVATIPETIGQEIKANVVKEQVLSALGSNDGTPVDLAIEKKQPQIQEKDLENTKKQAQAVIAQPITFTYPSRTFTATSTIIGSWIETKPVKGVLGYKPELHFNEDSIVKYINTDIASKIDQETKNARLAVIAGKVTIIEDSKDGFKVDRDETKKDILRVLTVRKELPLDALGTVTPSSDTTTIPSPTSSIEASPAASPESSDDLADLNQITLKVDTAKPDVTNDNINQIGIKERIAVSSSEFKGSPNNRQENIRVGTRLFNGIILKPGEQFSSVKSLGRIDESSGFKPELVIKQDQLIPEVGGGLCQVSTTLFRAAMNAGLKIDERRNHRFRVSYYEARPSNPDPEDYVTLNAKTLVGLDATIYDPSPDFKFTNDTDSYMLIQGRVEGTKVTFELFGTKDGRKVSIDGPYITSTTPAPTEIQYIDDPTLPAGQTKQKEKAVGGAKTSFTYKVEKDGKQLHKNTFTSNYTTWQAKFYRGTGPAAAATPDPNATPVATPTPEQSTAPAPITTTTPAP